MFLVLDVDHCTDLSMIRIFKSTLCLWIFTHWVWFYTTGDRNGYQQIFYTAMFHL